MKEPFQIFPIQLQKSLFTSSRFSYQSPILIAIFHYLLFAVHVYFHFHISFFIYVCLFSRLFLPFIVVICLHSDEFNEYKQSKYQNSRNEYDARNLPLFIGYEK